jgi:hypothetical protein
MASYREENLAEINDPPSAHVYLSRKGMPGPNGEHPQDFDINISNKPNIYLPSPAFSHGQLYVAISRVQASVKVLVEGAQSELTGQSSAELTWVDKTMAFRGFTSHFSSNRDRSVGDYKCFLNVWDPCTSFAYLCCLALV